jgi:hypothetical protein
MVLNLIRAKISKKSCDTQQTKTEVLCNQILDSLIVGGIAGFSAFIAAGTVATMQVFFIAFGLTFLLKLKDYRGIK